VDSMVGQRVVHREMLRKESDLAAAGPVLQGVWVCLLTVAAEALGVSGKNILLIIVAHPSAGRLTET